MQGNGDKDEFTKAMRALMGRARIIARVSYLLEATGAAVLAFGGPALVMLAWNAVPGLVNVSYPFAFLSVIAILWGWTTMMGLRRL